MDDLDSLEAELDAFPDKLVALEACWNGDTRGWFLRLFAIFDIPSADHPRYTSRLVQTVSSTSERRLFKREARPWHEARVANALGEALANKRGVPFYFPAPMVPDEQCARWWDRECGHPCSTCGVTLRDGFVGRPWPWPGACARCVDTREQGGGVDLNVHLTGVSLSSAEAFAELRDPWLEAIVGAQLGLVKLVNALSDTELWVMLVIDEREVGVEAVLAHLRGRGQLGDAVVTVEGEQGRFVRVWPR